MLSRVKPVSRVFQSLVRQETWWSVPSDSSTCLLRSASLSIWP